MDPLTIAMLGGGALGLINQGNAADAASESASKQANLLNSVPLPILKQYYPDLYKQVIALNPEAEQAQSLGPSAMENISVDPAMKQAQMNALLKLQQIGDEGGMTATDRARLSRIQSEGDANLRGQQGAIMQNLATRGMSGGGSELVARQLASQENANRQAQQGLDVASQAEQRALQAIMQSGQLGGQIGQQGFQNAAQIAQAKDAINKFNAANTQDVASRNVSGRNQAQQINAQSQQNIANQNTGLANEAQRYNTQTLPQQQYQNQMGRVTGQVNAIQNQQQVAQQNQQDQNQMIGGLIQTGAQYYGGQQKKNKIPGEV